MTHRNNVWLLIVIIYLNIKGKASHSFQIQYINCLIKWFKESKIKVSHQLQLKKDGFACAILNVYFKKAARAPTIKLVNNFK